MNDLPALHALGLPLPAPGYLFGAIVFGLIGLGAFRHGRRSGRPATLWLGVALMVYPYLIASTWALWLVGLALCTGIYLDHR
jgi:hypothetical protein